MLCPNCGQKVPDDSVYCPECGLFFEIQLEYAGFWRRIFAFLIDSFILNSVCMACLFLVYGWLHFNMVLVTKGCLSLLDPAIAVPAVASWLYYTLMESSPLQATFGKLVLGIAVIDPNGARVTFVRASVRYFAKFLSMLLFGFGFIMIFFTVKKQALHDIIADCLIIKK